MLAFLALLGCAASAAGVGGWEAADTPALKIPEAALAAFDKAMEKLVGVDYAPVALLATQPVAGTNYCLLCASRAVAPDAESGYSLVYVYRDLSGGAEILDIEGLEFGIDDLDEPGDDAAENRLGGWEPYDNAGIELSEGAAAAFEAAARKLLGVDYTPVAELATQLVAGTNYCLLCKAAPVVPDARFDYTLVYIYRDLSGGAGIIGFEPIEYDWD